MGLQDQALDTNHFPVIYRSNEEQLSGKGGGWTFPY